MQRIILCLAVALTIGADSLTAQVARRPFLYKDARGELAAARARGDADVLLVIAAMPGRNPQVARTIAGMGGTVQFREDEVDYLRARVPVEQVERLVADGNVHSVDISMRTGPRAFGLAARDDAAEPSGAALPAAAPHTAARPGAEPYAAAAPAAMPQDTPIRWPALWPAYPLTNRYDPVTTMNGMDWRRANPTWDGRGVTLAMIDLSMDPLLPELQHALTLDGRPVAKTAVYMSVTDIDEENEARWVRMDSVVTAANGRVGFRGEEYTVPRAGTFRIGLHSRNDVQAILKQDRELRDSSHFAVLWNEGTGDVWVDTDEDRSFANEKALTDYAARPEFGVIGVDDPDTPVRESIGFGIQIDRDRKLVALNLGVASHASLVVGAAVGSRGQHGQFDGVAPGARVANVAEGGQAYGQTEAVIAAFQHPDVDLAWLEHSNLITRNYNLRDGRLVPTVIYARLIEKYGKTLMVPTHNYPVLGAPDDFVAARGAIGVGGHESSTNYLTNHGVRVQHEDNLLITGGYGPMGDGALKPDIIAPSHILSTALGFQPGRTMAGLFSLPPGYTIAGGTSTATPTASGAVGLLMSAAKQTGIKHDAFRIQHALTRSARHVPHLPIYKQGNGVLNIEGAWRLLQALDTARSWVQIEAQAPVRTVWSGQLPTPHQGVGLYERDGWTAGDVGERTLTFTRTSGPRQPMEFSVSWIGNTGVFTAPASITLPLNRPVAMTVRVAPDTAGVHSALLVLDHPDVPGDAHRMMTTIVAAEPIDASNGYRVVKELEVPRPGMHSVFYRVPEGVSALRVEIENKRRRTAVTVVRPDTRNVTGMRSADSLRGAWLIADPMPGMWEIRLTDTDDVRNFDWEQALKDEPVPNTPATLTVSAIAAAVARPTIENDGDANSAEIAVVNRMAELTGALASTPLGSARREQPTIAALEQHVYEIDVPAGATALIARAHNAADAGADLDVYVFNCTGETCRAVRADGDPQGEEIVVVENPAAGKWKVVVDAPVVPSGSTSYDYLDAVLAPVYGMVSVADAPEKRTPDARWTARTHVWDAGTVPAGRVPFAALLLQVRTLGTETASVLIGELDGAR